MKKTKFPPRGIRNNNPLNIRRGKSKWSGEVPFLVIKVGKDGEDGVVNEYDRTFCQFSHAKFGWRAAFKLIIKYISEYGLDTIEEIINRWAPPTENNTTGYVTRVCAFCNMKPHDVISVADDHLIMLLGAAMCCVENGDAYNPFENQERLEAMCDGYKLAISF